MACAACRGHDRPYLSRELVSQSRKHLEGRSLTGIRYSEDPGPATVIAPLVGHLIPEGISISKGDATLTYPPTERGATIFQVSFLRKIPCCLKYHNRNRVGFTAAPYIGYPKEESVAGPDSGVYEPLGAVNYSCSPRCGLALPTMTSHPTGNSSSIFRDGKLKPGIYKIKNVFTQTFVDIEEHSRKVCSRPPQNLEEGNGLVRLIQ